MDITIKIDENLVPMLKKLAEQKNITSEDFLIGRITDYLTSEFGNFLIEIINKKDIKDLTNIASAIEALEIVTPK